MITLIHSFHKSLSTDARSVSNAIKACYLLADMIPIMGDAEAYILHIHKISVMSTDFKAKLMLFEFEQIDNQKLINSMNGYLNHKKNYAKLKYKSPLVVKTELKVDHSFRDLYDKWYENKKMKMNGFGFLVLYDLCDNINMGFYSWKKADELVLNKKRQHFDAENLFRLHYPDMDNKETMLVIDDIFYTKNILNNHLVVSPEDASATNLSNSYLYPVTELPNLHILSGTELISIRKQLLESTGNFRKLIDEWLLLCNTSEDKTAGVHYFTEHIIPEISSYSQMIVKQPILEFSNNTDNGRMYLFMGEITKSVLLSYYREYDYISEKMHHHLENFFAVENEMDRRIPVLLISKNPTLQIAENINSVSGEGDIDMEMITGTRKFIRID